MKTLRPILLLLLLTVAALAQVSTGQEPIVCTNPAGCASNGAIGNATTINGAGVPMNQTCLGSNGSSQLVSGTCGSSSPIANNTVLGNNSGSTSAPGALSPAALSTLLGLGSLATQSAVTFPQLPVINFLTPSGTTLNAFGDSITAGTGATGTCNSGATACNYVALTAYAKNWSVNNQAVGGASMSDQMVPILATSIATASVSSMLIGVHDQPYTSTIGGAAWNQFYRSVLASSAWLAIPATTAGGNNQKVAAQNAAVTQGGTWTNVSEYGGALGLKSTTIGDTLTVSLPGNSLYIGQMVRNTTNCTISVSVDGVSAGNYSLTKTFTDGNANYAYIAEAIRLNGFAGALQHTVVVTDVTPGTAGCEILYLAGSGGNFTSACLWLYLLTQYQTGQGQPYQWTKAQNAAIRKVAYELAADNLGVTLADAAAYLDFAVNPALSIDTVHPNNAGHLIIANATLDKMNNFVAPQEQLAQITQDPEFTSVTVSNGSGTSTVINPSSAAFGGQLTISQPTTAGDVAVLGSELTSSSGWTSTGWTGSYNAFSNGTSNTSPLTNSLTIIPGTLYQVTTTLSSVTAGSITVTIGGATAGTYTANGANTSWVTTSSSASYTVTPTSSFLGTVAISLKIITPTSAYALQATDSTGALSASISAQLGSNYDLFISGGTRVSGLYNLGTLNTGIGARALLGNVTGISNTAVGSWSLLNNQNGNNNTAIGDHTLLSNLAGTDNVAIGFEVLENNLGSFNAGVGSLALLLNTTGADNTALGYGALEHNTSASANVGIGYLSLTSNATGTQQTAVGANTLRFATGGGNTTVGNQGLFADTTGVNNTAVGDFAVNANTTGSNNTGVGYAACNLVTTGGTDTCLGYNAETSATASGAVQIGTGTNSTNNSMQFQTWNFLNSSGTATFAALQTSTAYKTTTYTSTVNDDYIDCDTTSGGFSITLEPAPLNGVHKTIVNIGSNTCTINGGGTYNIWVDGTSASTYSLAANTPIELRFTTAPATPIWRAINK